MLLSAARSKVDEKAASIEMTQEMQDELKAALVVKREGAERVFTKREAEHESAKTKLEQKLALDEKNIIEAVQEMD